MNLYLVQHGQAKSKDQDPEKHLTDKGIADTRKVAKFAAGKFNLKVDKIFHSGKTRARQTAEILAESINPPGGVEKGDDLHALDDPKIWADKLGDKDLMLVGHLPFMSKMASLLTCNDPGKKVVNFHNSGIVAIGKDKEGWSVNWIVIPEIL